MRSPSWKTSAEPSRKTYVKCANGHRVADLPESYTPKLGERTRRWRCHKCGIHVALPLEAENARV